MSPEEEIARTQAAAVYDWLRTANYIPDHRSIESGLVAHFKNAIGAAIEADRRSLNPVLCERIDKLREALRHIQDCGDLASARAIAYEVLTGTVPKEPYECGGFLKTTEEPEP